MSILLRGGTVIDPSQSIHRVLDIVVDGDKISAIGPGLMPPEGAREIDVTGHYVCPGLIDLHGHWYSGSAFGIDPNLCLAHGVTTVVDAGTTGFVNFADFRNHQIKSAKIDVLAFINIAATGISTVLSGELEDLRAARPYETADALLANRETAIGVKVRSGTMCGDHSMPAFEMALEAAAIASTPLMVHVGAGAPTAAILKRLRAGDILTHCFQTRGENILAATGLKSEVDCARKRGVLFDVGHGCGSFSWEVARKAFEYHFFPDTISTDLHRYSVSRWAIDMPTTMTKFLHLGMSLDDVVLKSTWHPAKFLGRENNIGTLKAGTTADLFIFSLESGEFPLEDSHLTTEIASSRIKPSFVLKAGDIFYPGDLSRELRPLHRCDHEFLEFVEETAKL